MAFSATSARGSRQLPPNTIARPGDKDKQQPYTFSTPEQLIEDFLTDVRRLRGE